MNNDLISRSALLELAHNHVGGTVDCNDIARFPSVDAVEVVRCRDCKHWGTGYGGEAEHVKVCEFANYMVGANGYCVYGERKMDAEVHDGTK